MATRKPPAKRPGTPIKNRNFLSPTGFKFAITRTPAAAFFCNQANIPSMDLGVAIQPTYLKDIEVPGDKLQFGDLTIRFMVDEDLFNYMEIHNWMRGLGYPEKLDQLNDLHNDGKLTVGFSGTEAGSDEQGPFAMYVKYCRSRNCDNPDSGRAHFVTDGSLLVN